MQIPEIRSLTLHQPYATFWGGQHRLKTHETRPSTCSWFSYRGLFAIHASQKNLAPTQKHFNDLVNLSQEQLPDKLQNIEQYDFPVGAIIGVAYMSDVLDMTDISPADELDRLLGHWTSSHKAIEIQNLVTLPEPIPHKGAQGLIRVRDEGVRIRLVFHYWLQNRPRFSTQEFRFMTTYGLNQELLDEAIHECMVSPQIGENSDFYLPDDVKQIREFIEQQEKT